MLKQLNRSVLYYDTDSVIYVSRPGQYAPPLGDYLGELTDELDSGEQIVEFVSGGPKIMPTIRTQIKKHARLEVSPSTIQTANSSI